MTFLKAAKLLLLGGEREAMERHMALLDAALGAVLKVRRQTCGFCEKYLTKADCLSWAESGLPERFLCCTDHTDAARKHYEGELEARRAYAEHGNG